MRDWFMLLSRALSALVLAATVVALPAWGGPVVLGPGEVDIDIGFKDGKFELSLFDHVSGVEYAPDQVLLFLGPGARQIQPPDPRFTFIGARVGNPVWIIPQILDPSLLSLGIDTGEIKPNTFATYFESDPRVLATGEWVRLAVTGVRGPGEFSIWQTDAFGNVTVWASTFEGGLTDSDAFFTLAATGDVHLNYGFTAPGLYEVDIQTSAFLGPGQTNPVSSEVVTLRFGVETTGPVVIPEPSAFGLLALGGWVLWYWRRMKQD